MDEKWVLKVPPLSVRPGRREDPKLQDAGFKGFMMPLSI